MHLTRTNTDLFPPLKKIMRLKKHSCVNETLILKMKYRKRFGHFLVVHVLVPHSCHCQIVSSMKQRCLNKKQREVFDVTNKLSRYEGKYSSTKIPEDVRSCFLQMVVVSGNHVIKTACMPVTKGLMHKSGCPEKPAILDKIFAIK